SFHPSSLRPFRASGGWKVPPPLRLRPFLVHFTFDLSEAHPSEDALLALLDQLSDLLAALAADLLVEGGAVLVAHGLPALAAAQLSALAADLLVEPDAALVAHAFAALAAGFADRHAPLAVHAPVRH